MTADLFFSNVEFFGAPTGQRIRAKAGEAFRMELQDAPEGISWATTRDPILKLDENGTVAVIMAENAGASEIQIQKDRAVLMYVTVEVFNPAEAVSLGASAGTPEPK